MRNALGDSDLESTPIGLGAWAIGGDWQSGWGDQDAVTAAIVGARNPRQIAGFIGAMDFRLTSEEVTEIERAEA